MGSRPRKSQGKSKTPRTRKTPAKGKTPRAGAPRRARKGAADFIVAGIGASAGGLTALRAFFDGLTDPTGLAVVIIQHLDPAHTSTLAELLAPRTSMKVVTVVDGMEIEPGTAYVIAPGVYLAVEKGRLRTVKPHEHYIRLPVDYFLRTLAQDLRERAAAVILSGTGTDGSLGVRSVKEAGGLVIAQSPADAEYDGMPRAATVTGAVDIVLPASEIPGALAQYAAGIRLATPEIAPAARLEIEDILPDILEILRTTQNHDFEMYKPATLVRCVARRLVLHRLDRPADYLTLLQQDADERISLFRDCLINVTAFFRDSQAFAHLAEHVGPELVKSHDRRAAIRIWVPACSTGEEAYSIGMIFLEAMTASGMTVPLQIFATDVDLDALEIARRGVYPESIASDVTAERLRRFFTKEDHSYTVAPHLRECIVFAAQNVLTDAPFSNLDLVSCRNLLIYLLSDVQALVLQLLHFSLAPGGVLFLGPSETVSGDRSHFEPVSQKFRIYRRIGRSRPLPATIPLRTADFTRRGAPEAGLRRRENLFEMGQRALLEAYTPASVMVDRANDGLYYFGQIDLYLTVASGEASQNVFQMAREGLRAKLRTALHEAREGNGHAVVTGAFRRRNGDFTPVSIEVRAISQPEDGLLLVSFIDLPKTETRGPEGEEAIGRDSAEVARLETELESTRRELQATISDLETSNEELKASNEEAMSLNEEYQSTNEELETSKEELQSLNEELTTLNAQLRERVEGQKQLADDLSNLLAGTDIATLFLDRDLMIRFFTPATTRLFRIIPTDIGRPLADLTRNFEDPALLTDAEAVVRELVPRVKEVYGANRRWYSRRVGPYRTQDERIEGVVITFTDVTDLKASVAEAVEAKTYAESIADTVRQPLLVLDERLGAVSASRSFYRNFHTTPDAVVGRRVDAIANGELNVASFVAMLEELPADRAAVEDFEFELTWSPYGRRNFLANLRRIRGDEGDGLILLALEDITERKRAVAELFQELLDTTADALVILDPAGAIEHANSAAETLFGFPAGNLVGQTTETLFAPRYRSGQRRLLEEFFADPSPRLVGAEDGSEIHCQARDGRNFPVEISIGAMHGVAGLRAVVAIRDVSAQREARRELEQASNAAQETIARRSQLVSRVSDDLARLIQIAGLLTSILSRAANVPELREPIERLSVVSGAMTDVVNALSDINQLEMGALVPGRAEFPVRKTLERMRTEFGYVARTKGVEFRIVPSSLTIQTDPLLFDRIMQNLVSNALNYTSAGKVLIGCRRRGNRARIEVWDTGRGIAENQLHDIFDPYYRIAGRSGDGEGLGLGLHLVRRLASLLDLNMDVRSIVDKGSMFAVEAPLAQPAEGPPPVPTAPAGPAADRVGVLLLDGKTTAFDILESLLRLEGYEAWSAQSAQQAFALVDARAGFPAVIVAGETLGDGSSGPETVRTIGNRCGYDVPAIILANPGTAEWSLAPADTNCIVLSSPVKPDDVIAHIARLAGKSGNAGPDNGHAGGGPAGTSARETVFLVIQDPANRSDLANHLSEVGHRVQIYESAEQFLSAFGSGQPGCVVADIRLSGMSGVELLENLKFRDLRIPVVLIADGESLKLAVSGIEAGAVGLLETPVDDNRLIEAVEHALERSRSAMQESAVRHAALERLGRLTPREREVVSLLVAGYSSKEIATELRISPRTVENHRANIRDKTGIHSLAELIRLITQLE